MATAHNSVDIEMIKQYMNVTGSEETIARNMLEAFNGNLELAINMFLEGGMKATETSSSNPSYFAAADVHEIDEDIRAPIPQQQAVLVEDRYHAISYLSRGPRHKTNAGSTIFDSCRDFKKETEEYEKQLQGGALKINKKKRLHELFRPPIDIVHQGDFQSARSACTSRDKWLLVNIQNSQEFPCQILNRDVWANKIVREIIEENFILWQEHHDSDAGLHYGTFYKIKNYPHIAVIDPRTGERMAVWENLGMKPTPNQFAELVTLFLSEYPSLNNSFEERRDGDSLQINKESAVINFSEDEQLETAIKASLSVRKVDILVSDTDDDDDDEKVKEEVEIHEPVLKRKRKDENENLEEKENLTIDEKLDKKKELQNNKCFESHSETEKVIIEEAKIMLRLPDGGRKQIRLCLTSKLKELIDEISKIGYPDNKYELIKSFPRQNISELDQNISLKQAGLHKQETLFVQDR